MRQHILLSAVLICLLTSGSLLAQGTYANYGLSNMDTLLEGVYNSVIQNASVFVSIASVIGVIGAIIMISAHIYSRLLRGAAVELTAILRPFLVLLGLVFYLPLITTVNALLSPTVYATKGMVQNENAVVEEVLGRLADVRRQTEAYAVYVGADGMGDFDKYLEVNDLVDDTGTFGLHRVGQSIKFSMESAMYRLRNQFRQLVFWLLGWVYSASIFIVNTLRTFTLAVLVLIGPLALSFCLFPGFQGSFTNWMGRYVTVYLWLPVANIFGFIIGRVQISFTELAIASAGAGGFADAGMSATDGLYFILLLTGVVGYFAVPTITSYMISASGATALAGGMSAVGRMALASGFLKAAKPFAGASSSAGGYSGGGGGTSSSGTSGSHSGGSGRGSASGPAAAPPRIAGGRPARQTSTSST